MYDLLFDPRYNAVQVFGLMLIGNAVWDLGRHTIRRLKRHGEAAAPDA